MEGADGSTGPVVRAFGRATYRPSLFGAVGAGTAAVLPKGDGVTGESRFDDDDNVFALESDDEEDKENRAKPVPAAFLLGPRASEEEEEESEVEVETQTQMQTQDAGPENETEAQTGTEIEREMETQDVEVPSRPALRRAIASLASEAAMDWSLRTWVQRLADDLSVSAELLAAEKGFIRDVVTDLASERAEELHSQAQSQSQMSQSYSQVTQMSQMSQADELFDGADDDDNDDNDDDDDDEAAPRSTWAEAQR